MPSQPFLSSRRRHLLRHVLFQLHLWVGVITGLYITLVCATGSALVFRIHLQRAIYPHLFTPSSLDAPPVNAAVIMESVARALPTGRLSGVDAPTDVRPTYLAYVTEGSRFATVLVDPATAEVLGELDDHSFVRTLQDLHFDLLAGRTGRLVNGVGAICLLVMCLTGVVIWWPGRARWQRGFLVDPSRGWRRINWDLHSAVGVWTVVLVAMWALTGINFAFGRQVRQAVNWLSPLTVSRPPALPGPFAEPAPAARPWRELVTTAQSMMPGHYVARVVVPSSPTGTFQVLFSDAQPTPAGASTLHPVHLDPFSGAVLQYAPPAPRSTGDIVMAWMAPLHVGNFGGTGVRVAWLLLGLAPPLLFMTGAIMWWVRVVRPRWIGRSRARRGAAIPGPAIDADA